MKKILTDQEKKEIKKEKDRIYREKNKEKIKKWREDNKERLNAKSKLYREQNKEKMSELNKKYKEKNKQKLKEQNKEYYQINKDKRKQYNEKNKEYNKEKRKEYYQKNKKLINEKRKEYRDKNIDKQREKRNIYSKEKYKTDILFKVKVSSRNMINKSLKRKGYTKNSKTIDILGCSFEEFKQHLESKFEDWMNWDNYGLYNGEPNYGWDIDHIIPLITASTEEDVYNLNHFSNLQPLCSKINRDVKIDNPNY